MSAGCSAGGGAGCSAPKAQGASVSVKATVNARSIGPSKNPWCLGVLVVIFVLHLRDQIPQLLEPLRDPFRVERRRRDHETRHTEIGEALHAVDVGYRAA